MNWCVGQHEGHRHPQVRTEPFSGDDRRGRLPGHTHPQLGEIDLPRAVRLRGLGSRQMMVSVGLFHELDGLHRQGRRPGHSAENRMRSLTTFAAHRSSCAIFWMRSAGTEQQAKLGKHRQCTEEREYNTHGHMAPPC